MANYRGNPTSDACLMIPINALKTRGIALVSVLIFLFIAAMLSVTALKLARLQFILTDAQGRRAEIFNDNQQALLTAITQLMPYQNAPCVYKDSVTVDNTFDWHSARTCLLSHMPQTKIIIQMLSAANIPVDNEQSSMSSKVSEPLLLLSNSKEPFISGHYFRIIVHSQINAIHSTQSEVTLWAATPPDNLKTNASSKIVWHAWRPSAI